jgi:hypothetical protein
MAGVVNNGSLAEFVAVTGHVTAAERQLDPALVRALDGYSSGSIVLVRAPVPWTCVTGAVMGRSQ